MVELWQIGVAYFVGLAALHTFLSTFVVASNFSRMKDLPQKDRAGIRSRILAGLHCLVSSLGAVWCLRNSWIGAPFFFDGNPNVNAPGSGVLVVMEISELLFTSILNLKDGEDILLHVHHIAGLAAEVPSLYFGQGLNVMLWVHLSQFTQPFLYGSWICYKLKMISGFLFPFCSGMALIWWFILRVTICSFAILYKLYIHRALFVSTIHFWVMMGSCAVFIMLNFIWFKALVVKAVSTFSAGKSNPNKKQ